METRGIITIENRSVVLPDAEVWMTTGELASLFYVRGVSLEAAIRRLGKDGIMGGESCRRIRLGEKCYTEVYGMEAVIALAFCFDTGQAALFRKWIVRTTVGIPVVGRCVTIPLQVSFTHSARCAETFCALAAVVNMMDQIAESGSHIPFCNATLTAVHGLDSRLAVGCGHTDGC